MNEDSPQPERRSIVSDTRRFALAGVGVLFVGVGAVGAVVPGLPTTIFLIFASACFAKSCPWLEDRLLSHRLFRPYMRYINGEPLTRRARIVTLLVMWAFVTLSIVLLMTGDPASPWLIFTIVVAAAVGSVFIIHWKGRKAPAMTGETCPVAGRKPESEHGASESRSGRLN